MGVAPTPPGSATKRKRGVPEDLLGFILDPEDDLAKYGDEEYAHEVEEDTGGYLPRIHED